MALFAFDGTWNTAKANEDPQYKNTNVFRFYEVCGTVKAGRKWSWQKRLVAQNERLNRSSPGAERPRSSWRRRATY